MNTHSPLISGLLNRCRFGEGPLDCALSGGPDSSALVALAVASGREVTAHHVNHHSRDSSKVDEALAREIAAQLGAQIEVHHAEVSSGPNFEARARAARRQLLPSTVATGHTMDDQAETVLLNLMRGTGIDGLRAMELGPRHPILDLRREETLAICAELQLAVALDPSNASPEFSRNRVRLEVLPMLADIASRDVVPLLARLAAVSAEEVDFLEAEALAQIPEVTDVSSLREAPAVLARRRLRGWLRRLDGDGEHPPSLAELERVFDVVENRSRSTQLAGKRSVHRRGGRLRLEQDNPPSLSEVSTTDPTLPPAWAPAEVGSAVVTPEQLQLRIAELGAQITADYPDDPPLLVGVLKGAMMFMTDLSRCIELPVDVDFMAVSSYGSATATSGVVRIIKDLEADLLNRHVIVVEDIIDSGLTLNYLLRYLNARQPKSLQVCALFLKEGMQRVHVDYRYVGFTIPSTFVVGYGLDVDERLRNLPTVYTYLPHQG